MASYTISFEDRPDHLLARVSARFDSLPVSLAYWAEIAVECRTRGHDQVLVVRKVRVSARRSDAFLIAAALRDLGFSSMRLAHVDQSPDALAAVAFGDSIALQRGIDVQSFPTIERATSWLAARAGCAPPLLAHASSAA